MDIERANRALEEVARIHNITVECVTREIGEAIREAVATNDPVVQARWRAMPCTGDYPNAAELVAYLGGILAE